MHRSVVTWIILSAIGGACHRGAVREEAPVQQYSGGYEYRVNLSGQEFGGVMVVSTDTIYLYPAGHVCQPAAGATLFAAIRYECVGIGSYQRVEFLLDRHNPVLLSKWVATKTVLKQRSVCVRYRTNAAGQEVCAQRQVQSYEADETRSGPVRVWARVARQ